ncbi:energy-coupling factor transporter transmembrane component T [Tessaracoccus sp. Z1128]
MQLRALPRQLHPFAWWGYALALAAAASMTTNPLLLAGIIAAVCLVTLSTRGSSPWAASFSLYLWLAAFIVALRVVFRIFFGGGDGPTVLFTLPVVPLPSWVQGIRLLGPVSLESLLAGLYDGLRLAAIIVCIGAAHALANPKKLLASLPGAFYELGTVMVVAVSALPQLGESLQRVLRARKLRRGPRSRSRRGKLRAVETIIVPVLSDALERSLSLAASMDVRGFGRTGVASRQDRRLSFGLGSLAMVLLALWSFRFLARSPDHTVLGLPLVSTALLGAGLASAVAAMRISGALVHRTQYRPIRWTRQESLVAACGVGAAGALWWVGGTGGESVLYPTIAPLSWPTLTPLLAAALALAALPAVAAPRPVALRTPA